MLADFNRPSNPLEINRRMTIIMMKDSRNPAININGLSFLVKSSKNLVKAGAILKAANKPIVKERMVKTVLIIPRE